MILSRENLKSALKKYFGHDDFRPGQEGIVQSLLSGKHTLAVMPTGGGKSLCYQLPAVISKGMAIVISPLIALMKDQVDSLVKSGISATFINSSIPAGEISKRLADAMNGKYKLMYLAPERIKSIRFLDYLKEIDISFIAVDEAHCISEWGHDFRPAYLSIPEIYGKIQNVPVIALTATATPEVQQDITRLLRIDNVSRFIEGFDRPNLSYITLQVDEPKYNSLLKQLKDLNGGSAIVYCGTRKRVESFTSFLKSKKISVEGYHAGMPVNHRKIIQERFLEGIDKVIVATNAFGMGIDKPDVRKVIHCDLPMSLEAYYQEAGRAGRDGLDSDCILLYSPSDRRLQQYFIDITYPDVKDIIKVYNALYDLNGTKIGQKPISPIFLGDQEIAARASIDSKTSTSVLNLLERNRIIRRGSTGGTASVKFTTSRERIIEYFGTSGGVVRDTLEALLRTVNSSSFNEMTQFDYNDLIRKHALQSGDVDRALMILQQSRIIRYEPPGTIGGITLLGERASNNSIPIDFESHIERRDYAIDKIDIMQRYAETNECKRNFILSYFQGDKISDTCGRCSSCTADSPVKGVRLPKRSKALKSILIAAVHLDGRFGKKMLTDFIIGHKNRKIENYKLEKSEYFGIASIFNEEEIMAEINIAVKEGLLKISSGRYPTVSATPAGIKLIQVIPKIFHPGYSYNKKTSGINRFYYFLDDLRESIAAAEKIYPRAVVSDKTLRQIAVTSPDSIDELKKVQGVGPVFINNFGPLFIKKIKEFHAYEKTSKRKPAYKPPVTVLKALNLLKSGNTFSKISDYLSVTPGHLAKQLQDAVMEGYEIDRSLIINDKDFLKLSNYVITRPETTLKDIRAKLNIDMDYGLLRVALALARKNNE